jgi:hypothetical protein
VIRAEIDDLIGLIVFLVIFVIGPLFKKVGEIFQSAQKPAPRRRQKRPASTGERQTYEASPKSIEQWIQQVTGTQPVVEEEPEEILDDPEPEPVVVEQPRRVAPVVTEKPARKRRSVLAGTSLKSMIIATEVLGKPLSLRESQQ